MTCSSPRPEESSLAHDLSKPLFELVRLLAREAARSDFATRCKDECGEA